MQIDFLCQYELKKVLHSIIEQKLRQIWPIWGISYEATRKIRGNPIGKS